MDFKTLEKARANLVDKIAHIDTLMEIVKRNQDGSKTKLPTPEKVASSRPSLRGSPRPSLH
jgi:hypothetical protein